MPTKTATKKITPAKKTVKSVSKKTSKKSVNTKVLVCAEGEACFWTTDGRILQNLVDLRNALLEMDAAVFAYHADSVKNDFANWVEFVLQDGECADALRKTKKLADAQKVLVKHLAHYNV